jgi:pyruvate,water dikinase
MGGMLSHGSILARELGIPAVANIRNARDYVADGDLIRVDGERGEVVLLTA